MLDDLLCRSSKLVNYIMLASHKYTVADGGYLLVCGIGYGPSRG